MESEIKISDTVFDEDLDFDLSGTEEQTNQEVIEEAITGGAELVSGVPEWFEEMSQKTNDLLIEWSKTVDNATEEAEKTAVKNVAGNEVTSWFTRFGRWIQKPRNLLLLAGAFVLLKLIRK